jgi:hypothetical protein
MKKCVFAEDGAITSIGIQIMPEVLQCLQENKKPYEIVMPCARPLSIPNELTDFNDSW